MVGVRAARRRRPRSRRSPTASVLTRRATSSSPAWRRRRAGPRRHLAHHPRGRGPRHRRRRGQRPGRARRGRSWACASPPRAPSSSATSTSPTGARREIREAGVGYIPEDRHRHGLLLEAPLWENRILGHQTERPTSRACSSTPRRPRPTPSGSSRSTTCARPSIYVTGGLALRRQPAEAHRRPRDEPPARSCSSPPTRPAASTSAPRPRIWDHIREARREGLAVLLISADLDELIGLSDTIRGDPARRLVAATFDPDTVTRRGPRRGDDRRRRERRQTR